MDFCHRYCCCCHQTTDLRRRRHRLGFLNSTNLVEAKKVCLIPELANLRRTPSRPSPIVEFAKSTNGNNDDDDVGQRNSESLRRCNSLQTNAQVNFIVIDEGSRWGHLTCPCKVIRLVTNCRPMRVPSSERSLSTSSERPKSLEHKLQ